MPHGSSSCHQSANTSRHIYANYTGWRSFGRSTTSGPFLFINVFMAWHRHILPINFIIQQSRSFEDVCVPLHLTSCLFPVPDSQPTATKLFQSLPIGSGIVFHSMSHPCRHFLSSAFAWRHTSWNCVIHNTYVMPAKWRCHFGHINSFYLLTYLQ